MLTLGRSEKPSSPAPTNSSATKLAGPSVDDIFGSSAAKPTATSQPAPPSAPAKGAFDDLDDDFEGLEDAKEGSADDDFANISRSGLDDYNAVFDNSPPPSQAKSESNATNAFGGESSFDFASLSGSAAGSTVAASSVAPSQSKNTAAPDAHDWDALFDDFNETPRPSSPPQGSASTSAAAAAPAKEAVRPSAVGRALTEEGEHDDPILKNLTSMGYSRKDALAALEKYDYNLERVS